MFARRLVSFSARRVCSWQSASFPKAVRSFATTTTQAAPPKGASTTVGSNLPKGTPDLKPMGQGVPLNPVGTDASAEGFGEDSAWENIEVPVRFDTEAGAVATMLYKSVVANTPEDDQVYDKIYDIQENLIKFQEVINSSEELHDALTNPTSNKRRIQSIIQDIATQLKFDENLTQTLLVLGESGIIGELTEVIENLEELAQTEEPKEKVYITVATKTDPMPNKATIRHLLEIPNDQDIEVWVTEDPHIRGGAIISSDTKMIDLSFRTAIQEQQEEIDAAFKEFDSAGDTFFAENFGHLQRDITFESIQKKIDQDINHLAQPL